MIENKDFDFLVTGAAGGIGSAIAKVFAAHGGELILADIDVDALKSRLENSIKVYRFTNTIRATLPQLRS